MCQADSTWSEQAPVCESKLPTCPCRARSVRHLLEYTNSTWEREARFPGYLMIRCFYLKIFVFNVSICSPPPVHLSLLPSLLLSSLPPSLPPPSSLHLQRPRTASEWKHNDHQYPDWWSGYLFLHRGVRVGGRADQNLSGLWFLEW